jgi:lysophospholipase L1-like esterase
MVKRLDIILVLIGLAACGSAAAVPVAASEGPDAAVGPPIMVAYTGSGATRGRSAGTGALNIGHQFEVTAEGIVLRDLGVWDEGANGLNRAHTVTLFALDKLGPTAIPTAIEGGTVEVPRGTDGRLEDGFRFAPLPAPLKLRPGYYALIAYRMGVEDPYGDGGNLPLSTTGVVHGSFVPYELTDAASPFFPKGGDTGATASVTFRYQTGGPAPLRILPLGDSITDGRGGSDAGYRRPLLDLLTKAGRLAQFVGLATGNAGTLPPDQLHHEGHNGAVIAAGNTGRPGLTDRIDTWLGPTGVRPDIILLMVGSNDVTMDYELSGAGKRLETLIARLAEAAPKARILVAQITPSADPAVDGRARTYNAAVAAAVAARAAAGESVRLVDMHTAVAPRNLRDNVHPNDAGYAEMAAAWFEAITAP